MDKVAVVILNWNQAELTGDCLRSVLKSRTDGKIKIEIVVVDNGSKEEDQKYLEKLQTTNFKLPARNRYAQSVAGEQTSSKPQISNSKHQTSSKRVLASDQAPNVRVIFNPHNLGFTGGNNVGIKYALEHGADYVFLLNNDTEIKDDCVLNLWRSFSRNKNIGIVAPKIYYAPGFEFHRSRYKRSDLGKVIWYAGGEIDWNNVLGRHIGVDKVDRGQFNRMKWINFATGCAMMVKKGVFERIGLLDERFFLYLEDLDFSYRATKVGFKILFDPKAIVYHKNAGSSSSGSKLQQYYMTRNRLLFGQKHALLKMKLLLLREAFRNLLRGDKFQKAAVRDFFLRRFGYKDIKRIE